MLLRYNLHLKDIRLDNCYYEKYDATGLRVLTVHQRTDH